MSRSLYIAAAVLSVVMVTRGYNVLMVQTPLFGGRMMFMTHIAGLMREKGHDVTMLLNSLQMQKMEKQMKATGIHAEVIDFPTGPELVKKWFEFLNKIWREPDVWTPTEDLHKFAYHLQLQCRTLLKNATMMRTLTDQRFDVAVVDDFWNYCSLTYIWKALDVPFVLLSSATLNTEVALKFGVPSPLSYVPHHFIMSQNPSTDVMSFWERLLNLYLAMRDRKTYNDIFVDPYQQVG